MVLERGVFTAEQFTEESNRIKDIFIEKMKCEGIISEDQLQQLKQHSIIIAKKSMLGKFWDSLWAEQKDWNIMIVKVIQ